MNDLIKTSTINKNQLIKDQMALIEDRLVNINYELRIYKKPVSENDIRNLQLLFDELKDNIYYEFF